MKTIVNTIVLSACMLAAASCEILDNDPDKHVKDEDSTYVGLEEVAELLALIPLKSSHVNEVHDAVTSSSGNGYDEEYTMKDLFERPGAGVGDLEVRSGTIYENPLRDLIKEHVYGMAATRSADDGIDPDRFLEELMSSDIQIYWPFSDSWDGEGMPIITYDPEDGSDKNMGYRLVVNDDGSRSVESLVVDEALAEAEPVWVVNRNSDAGYATLEMLRREDPDWGEGGGTIIVRPSCPETLKTRAEVSVKSLILKDFTMNRSYDTWFAGASEFFVKTGSVEDFTASTEAELRLYSPTITDFLIVVKRSQIGEPLPFNAMLVSDWTGQMTHCAFMITEDDGGTITEWNCTALVRIASKSYGFEIKIPFNSRDDVVWRGQLSSRWLEANSNLVGHFGDVDLTFEVVEYDQ
ncbi:MAG: hypothetical protein IKT69_02945 [Bacteroidales bacterium]|nr:hypothetical protein [Bacteroidales bacterium]